jgi:hypothetical protein
MKRVMSFLIIVALLSVVVIPASAASPDTYSSRLHEGNGLIDNYVTSLVMDTYGDSLYIGTQHGLSVYDSTEEEFTFNSTLNGYQNRVYDIALAYSGAGIYILTNNLSYPVKTYFGSSVEIKNITFPENPGGSCICHTLGHLLYIGSYGNGLFEFNLNTYNLTQYNMTHGLNNMVIQDIVTGSVNASSDWIFIGTNEGVSVFDISAKTFLADTFSNLHTLGQEVQSLCFDDSLNVLYIGTEDGVYIYDISETGATAKAVIGTAYSNGGLTNDNILSLGLDAANSRLYIGTGDGFNKYDVSDENDALPQDQLLAFFGIGVIPDDTITAIAIDTTLFVPLVYAGMQTEGVAIFTINSGASPVDIISWLEEWGIYALIGAVIAILTVLYGGCKWLDSR